jgi:hypothetical protein
MAKNFMALRILAATFAITLMTASAAAQGVGGLGGTGGSGFGGRHQQRQKTTKTESSQPKVDESAYKAALKSVPDKPFDPWNGVR